jgi:hypothetical protein
MEANWEDVPVQSPGSRRTDCAGYRSIGSVDPSGWVPFQLSFCSFTFVPKTLLDKHGQYTLYSYVANIPRSKGTTVQSWIHLHLGYSHSSSDSLSQLYTPDQTINISVYMRTPSCRHIATLYYGSYYIHKNKSPCLRSIMPTHLTGRSRPSKWGLKA